ncbi:MAG: SAM-dependent chlorinase/fluorinase [Bacteroidota bacterium]|nr:SAM-dependent chlorinase/fluorinase [Bacteroidota bacterium]
MQYPIITITSDTGADGYMIPVMKGHILSRLPEVKIIDISHSIKRYDLNAAGFVLGSCWFEFPEGTLHLLPIEEPKDSSHRRFLLAGKDGHRFMLEDNGVIDLLLMGQQADWVRRFDVEPWQLSTPHKDIYANYSVEVFRRQLNDPPGIPINDYIKGGFPSVYIDESGIVCEAIHIDQWGNVITNLSRTVMLNYSLGKPIQLTYRNRQIIEDLVDNAQNIPSGEQYLSYGMGDYLQICIKHGNASELLGLGMKSKFEISIKG